jgi:hypothetical protein
LVLNHRASKGALHLARSLLRRHHLVKCLEPRIEVVVARLLRLVELYGDVESKQEFVVLKETLLDLPEQTFFKPFLQKPHPLLLHFLRVLGIVARPHPALAFGGRFAGVRRSFLSKNSLKQGSEPRH